MANKQDISSKNVSLDIDAVFSNPTSDFSSIFANPKENFKRSVARFSWSLFVLADQAKPGQASQLERLEQDQNKEHF